MISSTEETASCTGRETGICRCGFCLRLQGFRLFRSLGFCGFCRCSFFCCFVHCFYLCFPLYLSENSFFRFFQNAEHDLVFRNAELFDRQMLCFFDAFLQ